MRGHSIVSGKTIDLLLTSSFCVVHFVAGGHRVQRQLQFCRLLVDSPPLLPLSFLPEKMSSWYLTMTAIVIVGGGSCVQCISSLEILAPRLEVGHRSEKVRCDCFLVVLNVVYVSSCV